MTSPRPRAGVQNVIIFFSDGAADTGPTYYSPTSPHRIRPCHQGVISITAESELRQMASKPSPGDLTRIYTQIASEIGGTRPVHDE